MKKTGLNRSYFEMAELFGDPIWLGPVETHRWYGVQECVFHDKLSDTYWLGSFYETHADNPSAYDMNKTEEKWVPAIKTTKTIEVWEPE